MLVIVRETGDLLCNVISKASPGLFGWIRVDLGSTDPSVESGKTSNRFDIK